MQGVQNGTAAVIAVSRAAALGCAAALVCSCAGLTQLQDTALRFDQGVHAAAAAEMTLFQSVQAAQCNRDFYRAGFEFSTAERDSGTGAFAPAESDLDMRTGQCAHTELTDDELALRQRLLDTVTLYADAIQSLTNGSADQKLGDEALALAGHIHEMGEHQGFSPRGQTTASALNAAVITVTELVLDHTAYRHVRDAAAKAQGELATVVAELKAENTADAVGLQSKADALANEMRSAVSAARDEFGPASFLHVVYARLTLQSLVISPPDVAQMNAALDAIVNANAALARSSNGGAIPAIADLVTRAQQASTLFHAGR
jgi:predicted Zn-dependent protease with MMP-like domain